jgi:electron transport complex protein RnfG
MSNWNKIFKPIVVLCVICIIITGALAATNNVTAPIIEEATLLAAQQSRMELLPDADDFTLVEGIAVDNVSEIYQANNGVGTIITSSAKGYGGDVVVMTAFTPDGNIKQIKVTEQEETKGIGSNVVSNSSYWEKYAGLSGAQALVLDQDVDRYSGATISSRAVNTAVNAAIEAYNMIP